MIKMLYLTNIPTPYRNKRFDMMDKIFNEYGIELQVYYMRATEQDHRWSIDDLKFNHNFYIDKGFYKLFKGIHLHFNPKILKLIRKNNFDIVVVGGISSPTHWFTPYLLKKDQYKILSAESNPYSEKRKSKFARNFKKLLINRYDSYQITGNRAKDYLEQIKGVISDESLIRLPNLIDEDSLASVQNIRSEIRYKIRQKYLIKEHEQLWICPARLESFKGLDLFLPATEGLQNIKIVIAGEGSQRSRLEKMVSDKDLPVLFTGHMSSEEISLMYWSADLFLLPSIRDASPLAPIEASYTGLPLLLSTRIGNFEDVYIKTENQRNGWGFNPYKNQEMLPNLLKEISKMDLKELKKMGELSKQNYNEKFNIEKCVHHYAQQLLESSNGYIKNRFQ